MNKQEIIDAIKEMTVLELNELVEECEEVFGVSAAPVAVAAAGGAAAGGGDAAEEKTEFDVILESAGSAKLKVVKEVKTILGVGLKEAKELVDGAPGPVKEGVPKAEAEELKEKLEAVGASVELK